MIKGSIVRATWGTEEVEIPPLKTSDNGWYYDYHGNVLGRGNLGEERARTMAQHRVTQELASRDYAVPDTVYPTYSRSTPWKVLEAWIEHPGFGDIGVWYDTRQNKLGVEVHPVLKQIAEHHWGHQATTKEITKVTPTWEVANNIWDWGRSMFPVLTLVATPEITVTWQEKNEPLGQSDGSFTQARDSYSYFMTLDRDQLEAATHDKISSLIQLFNAFGHHNIRILSSYAPNPKGYGIKHVVSGVQVTVTPPDMEEAHTVTISSSGQATVKCGYRESEEKYLDYQKRQLAGWMQDEFASGEFDEITFD